MRNLIRKAPPWIKNPIKYVCGLIPYERRLEKVFEETYNFLQESQWWSKGKLEEYQMRELEKLLKHAYENVPYYQKAFDERGLKPKDIQDFNVLNLMTGTKIAQALPILASPILTRMYAPEVLGC